MEVIVLSVEAVARPMFGLATNTVSPVLASSTVKEIASLLGDVSSMVPSYVEKALKAKVSDLGDGHSPPNSLRD